MTKKNALAICLVSLFLTILCTSNLQVIDASSIIQAGLWVQYEVKISPLIETEVIPKWIKFEYISIEGTNATVQVTMHLSDGDEWKPTTYIDVVSGSETGLIIPSGSKIPDHIPVSGYRNITIKGESTLTYTGVSRRTVFADYKNSTDSLTCFWDKQTGIMLEQNITKYDSSTSWKITDTNLWQTQLNNDNPYQNLFYLIIALGAIAVLILFLRTRKKTLRYKYPK